MRFITIIIMLVLASPAFAWELNNNSQDRTSKPNELKYNPVENQWSYEKPDSQLKYNPNENKFEYTAPNSELKYNPMENKFEYTK